MDEVPQQSEFEVSRKAAKRAQITLNVLVVLSAISASVFFVYVLHNLQPFGQRQPPEVNVPTSAISATVGMLRTDKDADFSMELRDIDEASGYRDALTDTMRKSLAIEQPGRLYRLRVRNGRKDAVQVKAPRISIRDKNGTDWNVRWLAEVANAANATPSGRMLLGQAEAEFTLAAGESRQLLVFIAGAAPVAEDFSSAEFKADNGLRVAMNREDVKVGGP